MLEVAAAVGALSLAVTKATDFFRNLLDKDDSFPKWVWNLVALVIGLAFALGWNLDLSELFTGLVPALEGLDLSEVAGETLTGAVIGLGAGFWHELLAALSEYSHKA